MDTLEFLRRGLPSSGVYVATTINGGAAQTYCSSIEELSECVVALDAQGKNTYYAIASYIQKGNRRGDNVAALKVVAVDIDCGEDKPYEDWKQGLLALNKFIVQHKLPKPMIVSSGNGLHVYWVLTAELPPDEWKPIALALKTAALESGFEIDPAVTGDTARILRPTGTTNPKNGKTVKLLIDAEPVSKEELSNVLSFWIKKRSTTPSNSLLDDLKVRVEYAPSVASSIETKCAQVKWGIKNQSDLPEPFWYALMGLAGFCENPEEVAVAWSQEHPDFDRGKTIAKMEQWRTKTDGPPTCERFKNEHPKGCDGCPFKGRITSPAQIGKRYQEVQSVAPDAIATELPLPPKFKRTSTGIKLEVDSTDIDVCPFDIYPVSYGRDESLGYEVVRYRWNRSHVGWTELVLRQAYLAEGSREFAGCIADQGIVLISKKQTELFQYMLRSYMNELRKLKAMTNLYSTMGWKENFTQFVIGNNTLRRNPDGTVTKEAISISVANNKQSEQMFTSRGTKEAWADATSLFEKCEMHPHKFFLGVGFAAPLYAFTGLPSVVFSMHGESGAGKTLAQYFVQSIYGNPSQMHLGPNSTQNSIYNRLAFFNNLPVTIDEATIFKSEQFGEFIYLAPQGKDRARLDRNGAAKDTKTWATPILLSTNNPMTGKIMSKGKAAEAQLARLLEANVPKHKMFKTGSDAGRRIYDFLTNNHGVVGEAFITHLLSLGPDSIDAMIADAFRTFSQRYHFKFAGEERYWEQGIVLNDLGLSMAYDLGLIKYDYKTGIRWMLDQVAASRHNISEVQLDSYDILAEFLNANTNKSITMMHTLGQKSTMDMHNANRTELRVRFDLYRDSPSEQFTKGTVLIDRTYLRMWMAKENSDYKLMMQDIERDGINATPRSGKASLGKDTHVKLPQVYVLGVNLNHPRLRSILDNLDQAYEDMTLGKMSIVEDQNTRQA